MKFEFNQGVPKECIKWLWSNIGSGNVVLIVEDSNIRRERQESDAWYYERVSYEIHSTNSKYDSGTRHVPTIFIEDEKKAILFALRWS